MNLLVRPIWLDQARSGRRLSMQVHANPGRRLQLIATRLLLSAASDDAARMGRLGLCNDCTRFSVQKHAPRPVRDLTRLPCRVSRPARSSPGLHTRTSSPPKPYIKATQSIARRRQSALTRVLQLQSSSPAARRGPLAECSIKSPSYAGALPVMPFSSDSHLSASFAPCTRLKGNP
jgi:hypothetical protein